MKPEILKLCLEKGILLERDVGELLSELGDGEAKNIIEKISFMKGKIITKSFFEENLRNFAIGKGEYSEKLKIRLGMDIEISREISKNKDEDENKRFVKVLYSASNYNKKLTVQDFVKYFRARYSEMRRMLQERPELDNLVSINKIPNERQSFSIVGMVTSKRVTKNKNIILELEDLNGRINVLITQSKTEAYEKAKDVVTDIVIGIKGSGSKEMMFANDIIFPDSILSEKSNLDRDEAAVFISDIHVGSKMFLEHNFLKFIGWINGNSGDEKQKEEALKVKYIFITGDSVDGIGVYPSQEAWLNIKDIKEQYVKLASLLKMIRKEVTIIMCPGQHDAVRVAEPQPAIDKEYAGAMHELENVILVSNPAFVEIMNSGRRGVRVLMYHGASMNSVIGEVDSLRSIRAHDTPSKAVRYLLKARHLSPIHSSVTYIPDERADDLLIREVPDVITTADLHRPDVDIYNNVLIICSSCWQSITPFEEKVGNHPDPCKVPVLNLKTRQIKIIDFSDRDEEKTCVETESGISCSAGGEKT